MAYSIQEIAQWVGGTLLDSEASDTRIEDVCPFHSARPGSVTFLAKDKTIPEGTSCPASAILVDRGRGSMGIPTIEVDNPFEATLRIAERILPKVPEPQQGIHPTAVVDPTAQVDPTASIGPYVVIEAHAVVGPRTVIHSHSVVRAWCQLGADIVLNPHVVLYPFTQIEDRTILHSGVVLGADGFGYKPNYPVHTKVPQLGNVAVGSDVEIGANSTVDCATLGSTTIGMSTKIDNLVMIGHNCQIGPRNIMAAHVGLSGSCKTGDMVWMAGKVGIADHVEIGDGALLLAYAGIPRDIKAGERVIGCPARSMKEFAAEHAALAKLPGLIREFREWKKKWNASEEDQRKCA